MKYLKWPLIILSSLIVIYLILCAVGPKNVNVTKEIDVKAKPAHVFNLVNNLVSWNKWSSWNLNDTSMVIDFPGKKEGVGALNTWKSESQGNGSQEIIESDLNSRVKTRLQFEGWDGYSYGEFKIKPNGDETNVSWSMSGDKDFPFMMRGMMLAMGFKRSIKKNYTESLKNIKGIVEPRAQGKYDGYEMKIIDMPEKSYVYTRSEVETDKITQFYATNFVGIARKIGEARLVDSGQPSGLFFKPFTDSQTTDMAAAIPVSEGAKVEGYSTLTIPKKKAIQLDYYGDYSGTIKAHNAIGAYLKDNGILHDPPVVEEYITDPGQEKDPTKWLTKVTYYLAE